MNNTADALIVTASASCREQATYRLPQGFSGFCENRRNRPYLSYTAEFSLLPTLETHDGLAQVGHLALGSTEASVY